MERKAFLKLLLASAATGSAIAFIESCKKSDTSPQGPAADFTLDLGASVNSALLAPGGYVINSQVMVINSGGTYIALSDLCTHEGCALNYDSGSKQLVCYCHGSYFNTSGGVISGPANAPLKTYTVTHSGNTLHVQG